jgi:hypothetical protein
MEPTDDAHPYQLQLPEVPRIVREDGVYFIEGSSDAPTAENKERRRSIWLRFQRQEFQYDAVRRENEDRRFHQPHRLIGTWTSLINPIKFQGPLSLHHHSSGLGDSESATKTKKLGSSIF